MEKSTDDEKESLSDEFAERYEGKADEFVEFISGSDLAAYRVATNI